MKNVVFNFFTVISLMLLGCKQKQQQEHSTGLVFSTPEQLASIPMASSPFSGKDFASSVDLSNKLPLPGNQGHQGSCVAWALGYGLKGYQEKLETNKSLKFSPSFIYNQINNGRDGGCQVIEALNLLSQQGICTNDVMPYQENDFLTKPNEEQRSKAKKYKIDYWRRVNVQDIKEVKAQLSAGLPVIIGVRVDDGLNNIRSYNGVSIWKNIIGKYDGGHAMLAVGYDDAINAFKFINSWGTSWGNNGYGWMDYSLFPKVVEEAYVAKDAVNSGGINDEIIDEPVTPEQDIVTPDKPDFDENVNTITHWEAPADIINQQQKDILDIVKKYPPQFLDLTNKDDLEDFKSRVKQNPKYSDSYRIQVDDWLNQIKYKLPITFFTSKVFDDVYDEVNKCYALKIIGNLIMPPNQGKSFQIVTHYYEANTNRQVGSLISPTYTDAGGFAASATEEQNIVRTTKSSEVEKIIRGELPKNGTSFTWTVSIPYTALDIKSGYTIKNKYVPKLTKLYAIPTVYIDGFGVQSGEKINFELEY
jgi:Papain family cysteine protease